MHPNPSAVIFDCDGVLVDSEILAHEVELAVLAEIGLAYDAHEFAIRFMGRSDAVFFEMLDADGRERLGRSIIDEIRGPMKERYAKAIAERLVEVPGATHAIRALRSPKAVASSSTSLGLERKLKKVGHWHHFAPHIYSAEHVKNPKPAPDLFLLAAHSLRVAPQGCLVIEDTVMGVMAARQAGMMVWGFAGGAHMTPRIVQKLSEAGADRIVCDWAQAAQLFRRFASLG